MGYNKNKGTIAAKHYPGQLDSGSLPQELVDDLYEELYVYVDTDYRVEVTRQGQQWLLTLGDVETCEYLLDLNDGRLDVSLSFPLAVDGSSLGMALYPTNTPTWSALAGDTRMLTLESLSLSPAPLNIG